MELKFIRKSACCEKCKLHIPEVVTGNRCFGFFGKILEKGYVAGLLLEVNITSSPKHWEDYVYVGALAGQNYGITGFCVATGTLECHRNRSNLGGIIGANFGDSTMNGFTGTVYGNGEVGGIAGYNSGRIFNCTVASAEIKHYVEGEAHSIGGIVGHCLNGSIDSCRFNDSRLYITNSSAVKKIKTRLGSIVGHLENSTMTDSCSIQNSTWTRGNIKDDTFCFKSGNCRIGRMNNGSTIV